MKNLGTVFTRAVGLCVGGMSMTVLISCGGGGGGANPPPSRPLSMSVSGAAVIKTRDAAAGPIILEEVLVALEAGATGY
jgi:hypothetical protein